MKSIQHSTLNKLYELLSQCFQDVGLSLALKHVIWHKMLDNSCSDKPR